MLLCVGPMSVLGSGVLFRYRTVLCDGIYSVVTRLMWQDEAERKSLLDAS